MAHRPLVAIPISGSGTQTVSMQPGVLHSIVITTAGTNLDVFDHPSSAQGKKVANVGATTGTFIYDTTFASGLTVSATGSFTATIFARQRRL